MVHEIIRDLLHRKKESEQDEWKWRNERYSLTSHTYIFVWVLDGLFNAGQERFEHSQLISRRGQILHLLAVEEMCVEPCLHCCVS
jgi:hypothetical protein